MIDLVLTYQTREKLEEERQSQGKAFYNNNYNYKMKKNYQ